MFVSTIHGFKHICSLQHGNIQTLWNKEYVPWVHFQMSIPELRLEFVLVAPQGRIY